MALLRIKLTNAQISIFFLAGLGLFLLPISGYLGYRLYHQEVVVKTKTVVEYTKCTQKKDSKKQVLKRDFFSWFQ